MNINTITLLCSTVMSTGVYVLSSTTAIFSGQCTDSGRTIQGRSTRKRTWLPGFYLTEISAKLSNFSWALIIDRMMAIMFLLRK